ncbi:MAG: hypothetical protein F7B17_04040 [Desulfurococcales archaeon]|nr:hypothetical protein [Desulfurococcales archaeon]
MGAAKKLYRVYYNTFDDTLHLKVVEALKKEIGAEVVIHDSKVLPEFRFVEVLKPEPGLEDKIKKIVIDVLGEKQGDIKVDWVDTSS